MRTLLERAEAGRTNAQYELALELARRNLDSALAWLSRAAAKNHVAAVELLAFLNDGKSVLEVSPDPQSRERLLRFMEWLSESCWCAGWLEGIEFDLWRALDGPGLRYGLKDVVALELAVLHRLSDRCNGWYCWSDEAKEPIFVTTVKWREIVDRRSM